MKAQHLFVAFALSSLLLLPLACDRSNNNKSIRVLYLTIWAEGLNKQFHSVCEQWGKENGTSVEIEDVPLNDLSAKLATLVEAGTGADLAIFPSHLTIVNHERLADVSELVRELSTNLGQPYPVAEAMNRADGHWVGVPIFAWSHVWVYREDLLKAQGLKIPDTWDEANAVARKLTNPGMPIWGLGIGLGKDDDIAMFFQALLWSFGGSVFAEDGRTVVLDSVATRSAVRWLLDLYRGGVIPPGALGWDGASNNQNFLAGKIAITANSPTIYYVAKRENPELAKNITHSLYPKGPAGRFSYATGFSLSFLNTTKKQESITSLIRYIMRKDNYEQLIIAGDGSVNPLYTGIDALKLWGDDERLRPAFESLKIEKAVGWPGPVTSTAAEVFERRILTDIFARVINDGSTIDAAVTEAAKRVEEIVQRH